VTGKITVDGADALARSAHSAGRELTQWAPVNAAAAARVAAAAHRKAPKRTGRLAGSITSSSDNTGAQVVASVVYAKVQEYGWQQRNIAAQPYLRPALADNHDAVVAMYADRVDAVLSTVKGV